MIMKVVLDTDVLVSAVTFGGTCQRIIEMGVAGKIKIVLSQDILKEFAEVLVGKKFRWPVSQVQNAVHELSEMAECTVVTRAINVIKRDPDDNRILECAVSAKAQYIVSGDADLLSLKRYKRIKIVSPKDFYAHFHQ